MEMQVYDVCLMSDWHYDRDLLLQLESRLQSQGYTTYLVWPENLEDVLPALRRGELRFRYLVDRASNTSGEFLDVCHILTPSGLQCFEDPLALLRASDKALMHRAFQTAGVSVPRTLILEPFSLLPNIEIDEQQLQTLGLPFVIKPANTTGGGMGVYKDGRCLEDIREYRREYPSDKYLVQESIQAKASGERRFWFRVFYSAADVYSCWWNELTHVYEPVAAQEVGNQLLRQFADTVHAISRISLLQLFSTEIVLDTQDALVVVDYVNESPDLRRKSRFVDGVPDEIVDPIIGNLSGWIHRDLGGRSLRPWQQEKSGR